MAQTLVKQIYDKKHKTLYIQRSKVGFTDNSMLESEAATEPNPCFLLYRAA